MNNRINKTHIPEVSSTKFLGVTIDIRISWIPHIHDLHKGSSTYYVISRGGFQMITVDYWGGGGGGC